MNIWKLCALVVLLALGCSAQTCAITSPTSGQVLSGFDGTNFTVSLAGIANPDHVQYYVDGYAAYNPGTGPFSVLGTAPRSSGLTFPFVYNSYWDLNGPHVLTANVYDILNNQLATCTQSFSTSNAWPNPNALAMTITTGTPVSSSWSGRGVSTTVTATLNGAGATTDSISYYFYLDGTLQPAGNQTTTGGTFSYIYDTTTVPNGYHIPCVVLVDNTSNTVYPTATVGASNEWCAPAPGVNFQNGAAASQTITSAHDIFLVPGATAGGDCGLAASAGAGSCTLGMSILNADGTKSPVASPVFYSDTPSVASVNVSTGVVTAVAVAPTGSPSVAKIYAMAPTVSTTDLSNLGTYTNAQVSDAGHPITASMVGWVINVTGGTNAIPGKYVVVGAGNNGVATLNAPCMTAASSNLVASWGPTRQDWAFVWTQNIMPQFASNGSILTAYNPSTSFIPHEVFKSLDLLNTTNNLIPGDQPYSPGAATDWSNSALNTLEVDSFVSTLAGTETESTWKSSEASYVSTMAGLVSGTSLKIALTGQNAASGNQSLWDGSTGPASAWNPPAFQYSMSLWGALGIVPYIEMVDEINSSIGAPLWGPISYGTSSTSWLDHITCNGTTCTATTTNPYYVNASGNFIIHGSSVTGMNSAPGSTYHYTSLGSTSFSFPSTATAGTYGTGGAADSGFVLEPIAAGWFNSNTGYAAYNSYAIFRSQFLAAGASFTMDWPNAGGTNCASLTAWGPRSQQGIGAVTHVSDFSDMYVPVGAISFIAKRLSANELLGPFELGGHVRANYGCISPSLPIVGETYGTSLAVGDSGYGSQGYPVNVTSTSGNLITFASDSKIKKVFPGLTRLTISGAIDTGSPQDTTNGNFFVSDCPSTGPSGSTCHVLLEKPDFSGTGTGGTIRMADGTTWPLSNIVAGSNSCSYAFGGSPGILCGQQLTLASGSTTFRRERGQTFTLTGVTGATNWGTGTFQLVAENLNVTNSLTQYFYRQVPSLSATGGTAQIVRDETYIKGATGSIDLFDRNPENSFDTVMECMIVRCASERTYQAIPYNNGYSDQIGFTNTAQAVTYMRQFPASGGGGVSVPGTLHMNQHFENSSAVPIFQAINSADLMWNRWAKYIMQPALNSPDYSISGPECAGRAGSYGNIVFCWLAADAPPQTITFNLSPYLESGQPIIEQTASAYGPGPISILTAGTTSTAVTLAGSQAVFLVFPVTFASELNQPTIAARLADVTNAADIAIRYSYGPYWIDVGPTYNCGAGNCTPPWDRNIGPIWYRILYLGSDGSVRATSDIQQL